MTDNFDIEQFIDHYIKNILAMQQLSDAHIKEVMLLKIKTNPEYFEIIAGVSQSIDNKKLIKQALKDSQTTQVSPEPDKFSGRKIA